MLHFNLGNFTFVHYNCLVVVIADIVILFFGCFFLLCHDTWCPSLCYFKR